MNNDQIMKTVRNNRWMIWAILILAVMNITTLITLLVHRSHSPEEIKAASFLQAGADNASMRYSGRYFREQLSLNRDQMKRFSEFNPEFRNNVRNINLKLIKIRHQMIREMASETSDTEKLNILSDSVGHLHADLKKLTYKYFMDFKKICNREQQEKLEQMFGEMFAGDNQPGPNMQRGPYGRGYGRRFNN
ncbi:MAG TPA: hypothetical protein DDW27_12955 [Bacteroidales bacterium]|nr:hypothetical protein [Bacteroidales bacterium]